MKKIIYSAALLLGLLAFKNNAFAQGVAINNDNSTADGSAILDVKATDKGMLVPRMTQAQRDLIATPAIGLLIFQTDATAGFYYFNGTVWVFINAAGVAGPAGAAGANGTNGLNSLSLTTAEPAGANCTNGGVRIDFGLDANNNGTLEAGEINAALTRYVCNGAAGATGAMGSAGPMGATGAAGANGTNGLNSLSLTTAEPAGANCANGGVRIQFGLDANNNGTLEAGEINAALTRYVCNGANGAAGAAGPVGATGAAGPAGPMGATGAMGPAGPMGATGAMGPAGPMGATGAAGANGTNGLNSLSLTTAEPAGANCANGGVRIQFGLDANNNGTLEAGEINAALTRYVCNGANGAAGAAGPVGATGAAGPAGVGVPAGGTAGQVLTKIDGTDYNTQWATPSGGGSTPTLQLRVPQTGGISYTVAGFETVAWGTPTTNVSSQFNTTTETFTVATTGLYYINAYFAASSLPKGHNLFLEVNGTSISRGTATNITEPLITGNVHVTTFLTAGDVVRIRVRHNNTSANTSDASGFFEVIKLN
ncbi:DUF7151 family protein [Hugenholtzia roseola]|uniref:DUF7151 family protein n=1 Tax=Hugenholtzia roseola TaxID=1002 RepID=UPI00040655A1|nr:hypothetical protein [Hugenholtzia roseola]